MVIVALNVHSTTSATIPRVPEIKLSTTIFHCCPNILSKNKKKFGKGKYLIVKPKAPTIIRGSVIDRLR
jgi:hypothetical protein